MPKVTYIKDEATLLAEVGKTKTATILKQADPKLLKDADFIKKAVAINPYAIKYLDKSYTQIPLYIPMIYGEIFAVNGMAYCYAPVKAKNDTMCAFAAISNTLDVIPFLNHAATYRMGMHSAGEFISDGNFDRPLAKEFCGKTKNTYLGSRNVAIFVSKHFSDGFSSLARYNYADDEEIVRIAVETNAFNLIYASDRLKNNIDICKIAFMQHSDAFEDKSLSKSRSAIVSDREFIKQYLSESKYPKIPEEYADDDEIAALGLYSCGENLHFVSDRLKGSKTHAMIAVETYGKYLEFASDELKDDKDVVKAAVNNYGEALEFASDKLQDDEEIVEAAIQSSDGFTFEYASPRLKNDWKFIRKLLASAEDNKLKMEILTVADESILSKKEAIHYLVLIFMRNVNIFEYLDKDKYDKDFILDFVEALGEIATKTFSVLSDLPEEYADDEAIVSTCVGYSPDEFQYASERLLSDKDFILNLMTIHDVDLYEYIDDDLLCDQDVLKLHKQFELKKKVSRIAKK